MKFQTLSDRAIRLDLSAIRVTQEEILADLLYPATDLHQPAAELAAADLAHSAREKLAADESDRFARDRLAA